MKRVLHVLSGMGKGGIETWLMNVFRELNRSKAYPVAFDFLVETHEEQPYDQEIRELGGRIFRTDARFRHGKKFVQSMTKLLRSESFHGVHAHGRHFMAAPVSVARMMQVPVRVSHVHNLNEPLASGMKKFSTAFFKKVLVWNSTFVLGCSTMACESLLGEGCTQSPKISFLPYGIDLQRFKPGLETAHLRDELGISDSTKVLGHVGRFAEVKRHGFLLKCFAELIKRDPEWVLVLVGVGPKQDEMKSLAHELRIANNVRFLGLRSDIPELCTLFDVFALPSETEGLGLVLIEAQAVGTPCVVTETLPGEIDAVPGLTYRVPHVVNNWVQAIQEAYGHNVSQEVAHGTLLESQFYIENSVKRLVEEIYRL